VVEPGSTTPEVHWLEQVHGRQVVVVDDVRAARPGSPPRGDALVSRSSSVALCVLVADCAPIALASPEGVFAAVHAGWRGLADGVVAAAVDTMASLGATSVAAVVGPCIHPCCYAFGVADLELLVDAFGPEARSRTRGGRPALDLPAAALAALRDAGVGLAARPGRCTASGGGLFSHRARGDQQRQAVVVWRSEAGESGAGTPR